jgi:cytochrome c biogenesis protein ResB
MSLRGMLRGFTSARSTILLLCLLAVLLLLNVALPQEKVVGSERFETMTAGRPVAHFVLVTLGLGSMSVSPVFLAVLALFFLNLLTVLVARIGPTWRRVALKTRSDKGLQAWSRLEEARSIPRPAGWSVGEAARTLRGFGYQVRRPGERTLWAVKHRTAPLGFMLFHISFLLVCAGGISIYYTRFVGSTILSEGQQFQGHYNKIIRSRPIGPPPELPVTLESIDARFDRGEVVHLGAAFRFQQASTSVTRNARVNHPAHWGPTSLLVNRAGLAPVLWLQDAQGFTLDRIVVPARTLSGPPTDVALGDGRVVAFILPLEEGTSFPSRAELPRAAMTFRITVDSRVVFDGELSPGEAAEFDGGRLVLQELRYWVGMTVVSERGGGVLIAGFTLGIIGLIWRLLWYRREVAVTWDEREIRLVGRSEYFSGRFQDELKTILLTLQRGSDDDRVTTG